MIRYSNLRLASLIAVGALALIGNGAIAQTLSWTSQQFGSIEAGPGAPGCARTPSSAKSLVADANGNVYVTGCASNGANDDIVTYKLNSSGVLQWRVTYNGAGDGNDAGYAIALGADGHVVVTGFSTQPGSLQDARTIKYDGATGAQIWSASFSGTAIDSDAGHAVVIDAQNHVYVAGYTTMLGEGRNMVTVKYDGGVGTQIWRKEYDGAAPGEGVDVAEAIALDATGGVVVTGFSSEEEGGETMRTIKYLASNGDVVWSAGFGSQGANRGQALVIDASGNVFVAGYNASGPAQIARVVKYDGATGSQVWTTGASSPGAAAARAIALDAEGNLAFVGYISSTTKTMFVHKLNGANGGVLWNVTFDGSGGGDDEPNAVVADSSGNFWVTGYSTDTTTGENLRLIKYNGTNGSVMMNAVRDGGVGDRGYALAVTGSDSAVVAWHGMDAGTGKTSVVTHIAAPGGTELWSTAQPAIKGRAGVSGSRAVAVNSSGVTAVTGYRNARLGKQFVTARIDPATGQPLWLDAFEGGAAGDNEGLAVAINASGRIAVAGYSSETSATGTHADIRVMAYDANGTRLWSVRHEIGANMDDRAQAVAIDEAGDVYVAGYVTDPAGARYLRTFKYNGANGSSIWVSSTGETTGSEAVAMTLDGLGAVIVAGYVTEAIGGENMRTIKMNASDGSLHWMKTYNGTLSGSDRCSAVAVDKSGNVFVTGRSEEVAIGGKYRTMKYDGATGNEVWAAGNGGGTPSGGANAIAIDLEGNVIVTGAGAPATGAESDILTIKYHGGTGLEMWRANYGGAVGAADAGHGVAVAANGAIIVTGISRDGMSVADARLLKYEFATGAQMASIGLPGLPGGYAAGAGVAVNANNEIVMVGDMRATGNPVGMLFAKFLNPDRSDPPASATGVPGNGSIQVNFTPPANNGGSPIIDYMVTCGSQSATGTSSPITVTGLVNGTSYTCTITANNIFGSSHAAVLPPLTPAPSMLTVTVARTGTSIGDVMSMPLGISCGADCSEAFIAGTVVTLTATLSPGATVAWSGVTCDGGVNTNANCQFLLHTSVNVTATFAAASVKRQSDFNGDGRSDILWYNTATGMLYELQMNGFALGASGVIDQETDLNWNVVAVADLNNDGRADVVWQNNATGQVYGLLMNGTTVSGEGTIYTEPNTNWKVVGAGDFNADGNADLLWKNNATGDVFLLLLNGLNVVSGGVIYSEPNTNWQIQKVADFNGDGRADVLWRNVATGDVFVLLMNGTTVTGGGVIYSEPNTAWQIQAAADFNGDGRADVLWRNTTTGDVFMMLMNGTTITGGSVFYGEPNADWKIVATGDYNGDGRADILWRNTSTGQVFMMLMDGFTISGGDFVYAEPDQNWKILGP